jgi:hypothetical protein
LLASVIIHGTDAFSTPGQRLALAVSVEVLLRKDA